jgi:tetratricopeptide (TPR) repeat protein
MFASEMRKNSGEHNRILRVFLSSTFRDFMEERDVLVREVFPELRRKARERGVEVVDVDLRWGITEEESQQGKVIPICLGEIDRCRPYFVGMLGDRYGWIPPKDQYSAELIARQPWLEQHLGGVSVTELEILHGVLNHPEMAGHAFFYFRDSAWSSSQNKQEFICETAVEEESLDALKKRIRDSGFPVAEQLGDPRAVTDQIATDLWELIEEQYPDRDEVDGLLKEEGKHASYRRSRLGIYLGGKDYIETLESWITTGEQKVLITGDSGAGKSALIANWMEAHYQDHPNDVIYAHHLGCSNDASAIRPLLERLIETAKKQLPDHESTSLNVPQDWWELVAKAAEALQDLGRWAKQNQHRWIWVLDGLDRLNSEDQKALPWLPATIPEGVVIVASALDCPAREIVLKRDFTTLTIDPLKAKEQDALIQQYLGRYTKQLIAELRHTIVSHSLAGSPLFLRILLEELRQCGRFEILAKQLNGYLKAKSIADLYGLIFERLETDSQQANIRKVLTALWASRAGLSEEELLAITGLAPLRWAQIDLALEQALGRNGNRLVFDHDYLRQAVENRYLLSHEKKRQAHSDLADWFNQKEAWDERKSEELPWQWQQAERLQDLRHCLLNPATLAQLNEKRGSRETINYWRLIQTESDGELDELIADSVEEEIKKLQKNSTSLIQFAEEISELLSKAGCYRELLLRLVSLSFELKESEQRNEESKLLSLFWLAQTHTSMGQFDQAEMLYLSCLEGQERVFGKGHHDTLATINNLGMLYYDKGDYKQSESYYLRALEANELLLGPEDHPDKIPTIGNLGRLYCNKGDYEQAEVFFLRALEASELLLGHEHSFTITSLNNLGNLYAETGDYEKAVCFYLQDLEASERLLGAEHPYTISTIGSLGNLYCDKGDYEQAEAFNLRALQAAEKILGEDHPSTLNTIDNLGALYLYKGDYQKAETFSLRALEASERLLGHEHPKTLNRQNNLGIIYGKKGDYETAETFFLRVLTAQERLLGEDHPDTLYSVNNLGMIYLNKKDYLQAESFFKRTLEASERLLGYENPVTLSRVSNLGSVYSDKGDYKQAEFYFLRAIEAGERLLGHEHPDTLRWVRNLAQLFHRKGDYKQAEKFYLRTLAAQERVLGVEHPSTITTIGNLKMLYLEKGD